MVINTNISAGRTSQLLEESTSKLNRTLSRLASGSKIVEPQDGFLQKVSKALDRMSVLATLVEDETKSSSDVANYQTELSDLQAYISDIGTKDFNGVSLLVGEDLNVTSDSDAHVWELNDSNLNDDEIDDVIDNSFLVTSWNTESILQDAIEDVAAYRAPIGANIQRIQFTQEQVNVLNENLAASVSRIADIDVATESTRFAKCNILVQSGTAMLAQANLLPQNALRLLR